VPELDDITRRPMSNGFLSQVKPILVNPHQQPYNSTIELLEDSATISQLSGFGVD
jgi:hypothetical protein